MPESAPPSDAQAVSVATDADFVLGRAALAEVTDPTTVGMQLGSLDEGDGVTSVYFRADMLGYPGWRWTATIAHVDGSEPTVLETELTPGDGALLAPDWVPWVDRMADYRAAQDTDGVDDSGDDSDDSGDDSDDDSDDDDDESADDSDDDDDAPGISLLHSGDLDGVDIDSLDENADDSDADDSDDDSDDVSPDEEPLTLER